MGTGIGLRWRFAALPLVLGVFLLAGSAAASASAPAPDKVTLCHATASETNPYVSVTVDENSTNLAGHEAHTGPIWQPGDKAAGVKWGDIIPTESAAASNGTAVVGLNDTAVGLAWLANDCNAPLPPVVPEAGLPILLPLAGLLLLGIVVVARRRRLASG